MEKFYDWFEKTDQAKLIFMGLSLLRKKEKEVEESIKNLIDLGIKTPNIKAEYFTERMNKFNDLLQKIRKQKSEKFKYVGILNDKNEVINFVKDYIKEIDENQLSAEQRRNVILALVDSINILWNEETLKHTIIVEYKIDRLTQFQMGTNIELEYEKYGWRLQKKEMFQSSFKIRNVESDDLKSILTDIPHLRID